MHLAFEVQKVRFAARNEHARHVMGLLLNRCCILSPRSCRCTGPAHMADFGLQARRQDLIHASKETPGGPCT